jgi:hypothetical protein
MKVRVLFLFFLSYSFCLPAQSQLQIQPATIKKQVNIALDDISYEEVLKVVINNPTKRTLKLRWDKKISYQPYSWESQVCDKENSYPPGVDSNFDPIQGVVAPIILEPGESFDLLLTILPYNTTGQCRIELHFRELSQPDRLMGTAVFQVNIIDTKDQAAIKNGDQSPRIYPNPVHDRFFLDNTPSLSRIEVFNTLGRRVKSFSNPQLGDSYDASDLPQGVYLVSLFDEQGKVIRTIRLLRRDFRP